MLPVKEIWSELSAVGKWIGFFFLLTIVWLSARAGITGTAAQGLAQRLLPLYTIPLVDTVPQVNLSFVVSTEDGDVRGKNGGNYRKDDSFVFAVGMSHPGWLLFFGYDENGYHHIISDIGNVTKAKHISNVDGLKPINRGVDGLVDTEVYYAIAASHQFTLADLEPFLEAVEMPIPKKKGLDKRYEIGSNEWFDHEVIFFNVK